MSQLSFFHSIYFGQRSGISLRCFLQESTQTFLSVKGSFDGQHLVGIHLAVESVTPWALILAYPFLQKQPLGHEIGLTAHGCPKLPQVSWHADAPSCPHSRNTSLFGQKGSVKKKFEFNKCSK